MPVSKAQQKAVSKYMKENYDVYQIRMPKGRKAEIQAHAQAQGESVNGFINRVIQEAMDSPADTPQTAVQAQETPQAGALVLVERGPVSVGSGEIKRLFASPATGREYYVEPVLADDEWNMMQKAKNADADDPDSLPF